MIYWHTLAGGLFYASKAMIHYYYERIPYFKECAKKLFGISGIFLPAGTTPVNTMPNQIVPVIMNWIGCAGWLAGQFYRYYLYTNDEELLEKEILPFMEEAAMFYEQYLVKENGRYKIYPSVSPENTPFNLIPGGNENLPHPCPSVVNATMDIAIIKELLSNLITLTSLKQGYEKQREKWSEIISHLPTYDTTKDGDIREWQYEGFSERYHHRHLSHLYPVFPGNELVKGRNDKKLMDAFELATNKRSLGAMTGWSLAHMACLYARFEEAKKACECLDILDKSCLVSNLFTLHNDWRNMGLTLGKGSFAPIQLDAAMGIVNAIQEMLLYSGENILKLLPALPDRMNQGWVQNMHLIGGRISMEWDKENEYFHAKLLADRDMEIQLILPPFLKTAYVNHTKIEKKVMMKLEKEQVFTVRSDRREDNED